MKYYYCYSYPQKEFLVRSGCVYITAARNDKTGKRFWMFEGTEKLNQLLEVWRSRR